MIPSYSLNCKQTGLHYSFLEYTILWVLPKITKVLIECVEDHRQQRIELTPYVYTLLLSIVYHICCQLFLEKQQSNHLRDCKDSPSILYSHILVHETSIRPDPSMVIVGIMNQKPLANYCLYWHCFLYVGQCLILYLQSIYNNTHITIILTFGYHTLWQRPKKVN